MPIVNVANSVSTMDGNINTKKRVDNARCLSADFKEEGTSRLQKLSSLFDVERNHMSCIIIRSNSIRVQEGSYLSGGSFP